MFLVRQLAQSGNVHMDLQVEVLEMNMVATCEVRIKEVHARSHQLNSSAGRSMDLASTRGRLRRGEILQALQDWRRRAFVVHM